MKNLNYLAAINQLGYGVAGLNILAALSTDFDVALFPIGGEEIPPDKRSLVEKAKLAAGQFDPKAPSLRVWQQFNLAEHVGRGKQIGFPFFELRQLKKNELHHMNQLDHLVVASEWARSICLEQGIDVPVSVAPLGVDRTIFRPEAGGERREPDHTIFVNVGKWELRKGHDLLLKAFNRAFEPSDKVILKMLCPLPFPGMGVLNDRWAKKYATSKMGQKIMIEPQRLNSQQAVARFMADADCGVFPARAEGWNLDLLECMSCGLHTIATNYSAHTEFVSEANCRLIEVTEYEKASDGLWFNGEGEWAKLGDAQEEQLVEHLRAVHRSKQIGQLLPRSVAGIETATRFNWQATASKLQRVIEQ